MLQYQAQKRAAPGRYSPLVIYIAYLCFSPVLPLSDFDHNTQVFNHMRIFNVQIS